MKKIDNIILSDLYKYSGSTTCLSFFKYYFSTPGFRYLFWLRSSKIVGKYKVLFLVYIICRIMQKHYSYLFGIDIHPSTSIGKGFYIGHFSGIVVSPLAIIGNNVNISHCVTIGMSSRGKNKGYPIIGDCVYIGPGAKIIGNIKIGNNVSIGANTVVTKDVPENSVVVGIPARVISNNGSEGYIIRCVK